ncbi:MFS transporter [Streptomyces sp. NPDC050564]|uniref:MFS transporter n=1 Tax=Streptomyces sp. NPDC050564 TaxID=3365631 RepID=UPI0037B0D35D
MPALVPAEDLTDANSLLQIPQAAASVVGPGLAGVLVAVSDAGTVVAVDAVSYGVSVMALARLPMSRSAVPRRGLFTDLGLGWKEFTSRTWLWVTTLHVSLFNFVLWAPFLVLGPTLAQQRLGGAKAWGLVLALYGVGSTSAVWRCSAGIPAGRSPGPWPHPRAGPYRRPHWPRGCRWPGWPRRHSPRGPGQRCATRS